MNYLSVIPPQQNAIVAHQIINFHYNIYGLWKEKKIIMMDHKYYYQIHQHSKQQLKYSYH